MSDKITTGITYAASSGAIVFGLTANELAALIGAGIAIISFFVNVWFKAQHLKLAREKAMDACEKEE